MKQLFLFIAIVLGVSANAQKNPVININTPPVQCAGNTVTLSAEADANNIYWYDNAHSEVPIAKGNAFNTKAKVTTSYWAAAINKYPAPGVSGGKGRPSGTGSSKVTKEKDVAGLVFDAHHDFVLNSADVFLTSDYAGSITVELWDGNNLLQKATMSAPPGNKDTPVQFTIPLNFHINEGNNYKLMVTEGPEMAKDAKGIAYPINIGVLASITGSVTVKGTDTIAYYYLYNLNFSNYDYFSSERKEVVVTVDPTPPAATAHDICISGTVADLMAEGANIKWYDRAEGGSPLTATAPLQSQTYYVSQTTRCESARLPVAVTVHAPQAPKANAQTVCNYATVADLQADGQNLKWYPDATGGESFPEQEQAYSMTYYVSQTVGGCESARTPAEVTVRKKVPAPLATSTGQKIRPGMRLADLKTVIGENVELYDKDAQVKLDSNTILQDRTQYTVHQTLDGCRSNDYFLIYVKETTEEDDTYANFKYNDPVTDKLVLTNDYPIQFITVMDVYQDRVLTDKPEATSVALDVSGLAPGIYYAMVLSRDTKRTLFRFVKK